MDTPTDYFSSTKQLFSLAHPYSDLTKEYNNCMKELLDENVKYLCIGSWRDEVVPLYSSLFHGIQHDNIIRALFIKKNNEQDNEMFLLHLSSLLVLLMNIGIHSDLILYLSGFIRDSLGLSSAINHSLIHDEPDVYNLAVQTFMEMFKRNHIPEVETVSNTTTNNNISWISLLNESFFQSQLNAHQITVELERLLSKGSGDPKVEHVIAVEIEQMYKTFKIWKPKSKQMKNLKSVLGSSLFPSHIQSRL